MIREIVSTFDVQADFMELFFSQSVGDRVLFLEGDDHHHCHKTLRHKPGDEIEVTDGKGILYKCRLLEIGRHSSECLIVEKKEVPPRERKISIAITPTKNPSRLEWFVEKATETGIHEIIIYSSARTEKKYGKQDRLEKIIRSAMKQSCQLHMPILKEFPTLSALLAYASETYDDMFVGYCEETDILLTTAQNKRNHTIIFIGPEGDFTPAEIDQIRKAGGVPVSLGDTRLRTETAGLIALIMLTYG